MLNTKGGTGFRAYAFTERQQQGIHGGNGRVNTQAVTIVVRETQSVWFAKSLADCKINKIR